jgi:beta-galactosidase
MSPVESRRTIVRSRPSNSQAGYISVPHPRERVSFSWPDARELSTVTAYFTVDGMHGLPAGLTVRYWDGTRYVPVSGQHIEWAAGSNQPTTITFDPVRTRRLKLDMEATGFLQIAEVQFP